MSISSSSDFLREIRVNPVNFYVIHYSCQSLYDDNEGLSPRITSIAITHFLTEQTVSFSTHAIAEELQIPREAVRERFDEVERQLLDDLYRFVQDRRDKYWVHWNMRNLTYGFEHLEHRYRVLGQRDAPVIPVERRINLNDILADRYGADYAAHPRLTSLMELNGGRHRDFLTGKEEVDAFQNGEFIRMHNSTLCKVGFLHRVLKRMLAGRLVTASRGYGYRLDKLFETRVAKVVGLLSAIVTIALAALQAFLWV